MVKLVGNRISLQFATKNDKSIIYNMLVSPEIISFMFNEDHPTPTWDEFNEDEPDVYFSGKPSLEGNYLLIMVHDQSIGAISFSICKGNLNAAELDIWISSTTFLGQGYGREALKLLIEFVHSKYEINTFIIRPWIKNTNAIKAYKKCGFIEMEDFSPTDYYAVDEIDQYGEGDYGVEETANLIYNIKKH